MSSASDKIISPSVKNSVIGIVMGSKSDWPILQQAALMLEDFGVAYEARVVSAHRMPETMRSYAQDAAGRGLRIIIAGAGGAAHLPGMIAAQTTLPVLGVPVPSKALGGIDSLDLIPKCDFLSSFLFGCPPSGYFIQQ